MSVSPSSHKSKNKKFGFESMQISRINLSSSNLLSNNIIQSNEQLNLDKNQISQIGNSPILSYTDRKESLTPLSQIQDYLISDQRKNDQFKKNSILETKNKTLDSKQLEKQNIMNDNFSLENSQIEQNSNKQLKYGNKIKTLVKKHFFKQKIFKQKSQKQNMSFLNQKDEEEIDDDSNQLALSNKVKKTQGPQSLHNDRDSQKSTTSKFQEKIGFAKFLQGNNNSFIISIIKFIGYSCYLIVAAVALFNYFTVYDELALSFQDNSYYVWPMKYSSCLSDIFKNQNLILLLKQGDLLTKKSLPTSDLKNDYIKNKTNDLLKNVKDWYGYIAEEYRIGERRSVFKLMNQQNYTFWFSKSFNYSTLVGAPSLQSGYAIFYFEDTLLNTGPSLTSWVVRLIKGLGSGRSEYFFTKNSYNIIGELLKIQDEMKEQNSDRGDFIKSNLAFLMILVISLSFICLSLMIPLFSLIQIKREKILELFSTFSLSQIESMMQQIQMAFLNSKSLMKGQKKIPQHTHKTPDIKRQPLGQISSLDKFNKWMILIISVTYFVILSGPTVNFVLTRQYLQNQDLLMKIQYNLYVMKGFMQNILQLNFLCLVMKIKPSSKTITLNLYMDDLKSQFQYIDQSKETLSNIIQLQNSLIQNSEEFREFFFPIIESNMCDTLKLFPEYWTDKMKNLLSSCYQIKEGFLTKGYQASLSKYLNIFPTFYDFLNLSKSSDIQSALSQINKDFDIKDFSDFDEFLEEVVEVLGNFLVVQEQKEFNFIDSFQVRVLIFNLVLMSFVFLFGWYQFSQYLREQLENTTKLLTVIDITSLMDNTYILSYFKSNQLK